MSSQQFKRVFISQNFDYHPRSHYVPLAHGAMSSVPSRFNVSRKTRDFRFSSTKYVPSPDRSLPVIPDWVEERYISHYNESRLSTTNPSSLKDCPVSLKKRPDWCTQFGPANKQPLPTVEQDDFDSYDFCEEECGAISSIVNRARAQDPDYAILPCSCDEGVPQSPSSPFSEHADVQVAPSPISPMDFPENYDDLWIVPPEYSFNVLCNSAHPPADINYWYAIGTINSNQALQLTMNSICLDRHPDSMEQCNVCGPVAICHHLLEPFHCDLPKAMTLDHLAKIYVAFVDSGSMTLNVQLRPKQTATPFEFVSALQGVPVKYLDDTTPDDYYLWCAYRTLGCVFHSWPSKDVIVSYENHLSHRVINASPVLAIPQTFITDLFQHVSSVLSAAWDFIKTLPDFSIRLFKELQTMLFQFGLKVITGASLATHIHETFKKVLMGFVTDVTDTVKRSLTAFVDSGYCILFIKTIVRLFMGYTPFQLGMEFVWDPAFIESVSKIPEFVTQLVIAPMLVGVFEGDVDGPADAGVAQSPDTPLMLIMSALALSALSTFGGLCLPDKGMVLSLTKMFTSAAALVAAGDKLGFGDCMLKIQDYMTDTDPRTRELKRWQIEFPYTVKFVDLYTTYATGPTIPPSVVNELRFYYGKYLSESSRFNEDRHRISAYAGPALKFIHERGDAAIMATRLEPAFILFAGEPGLGKSLQAKMLAHNIARARLAQATHSHNAAESPDRETYDPIVPAPRTIYDLIYNVSSVDKYTSGYAGQDIWFFDDWLQKNDSDFDPSIDVSLLFTLVTSQPMPLNMAAVGDKGTRANCDIIIGATNVNFVQDGTFYPGALKPYVKSIQDVAALRRRIKFVVVPIVKSPYVYSRGVIYRDGAPISAATIIDPSELYDYEIYDSSDRKIEPPFDRKFWTWADVQRLAFKEYMNAVNYHPPQDDDSWRFLLEPSCARVAPGFSSKDEVERAVAQGFFDYIGVSRNVSSGDPVDYECFSQLSSSSSDPAPAPSVFIRDPFETKNVTMNCPCGVAKNTFAVCRRADYCLTAAGFSMFKNAQVVSATMPPINSFYYFTNLPVKADYVAILDLGTGSNLPPNFNDWAPTVHNPRDKLDFMRLIKNNMQCNTLRACCAQTDITIEHADQNIHFQKFHYYYIVGVSDHVRLLHVESTSLASCLTKSIAAFASFAIIAYACKKAGESLISIAQAGIRKATRLFGSSNFVYDHDSGAVEAIPQSTSIVISGNKRYVMVRFRNGAYRLYPEESWIPQGPENVFSTKFSNNSRFNDQFPSVVNNLWAVVRDSDGVLCGTLLALNENSAIVPYHVALCMLKAPVTLRKDNTWVPLTHNISGETSFVIDRIAEDVACLHFSTDRLPNFRLPYAKAMRKKFSCYSQTGVPKTCNSIFAYRTVDGSLSTAECSISPHDIDVGYAYSGTDFRLTPSDLRVSTFSGLAGACGGVYLHNGETNTDMIVGLHVAWLPKKQLSAVHVVTTAALHKTSSIFPTTSYASEDLPAVAGVGVAVGLPSAKHQSTPSYVSKPTRGVTLFSDATECKYALSPVSHFTPPGSSIAIDPVLMNISNIASSSRSSRVVGSSLNEAVDRVLDMYRSAPHFEEVQTKHVLLDWPDVVSSNSGLPHIDLNAASGYPLNQLNPQKRVLFDIKGALLPDAIQFLDEMEQNLVPHNWVTLDFDDFPVVDCICTSCPKVEPRPLAKAQVGKTRIFTVCPIQEFLMQRKYFLDFAKFLTDRNLSVNSALGLGPEHYGHLHCTSNSNRLVMTGDFDKFDQSFSKRIIKLATRLIIKWYGNVPGAQTRQVDPDLPPLDRANFMRYKLLLRLSHFKALVGDEIVQFQVTHPSGSFLTTILNIITQSILWDAVFYDLVGPTYREHTDVHCLGDDSIAECDPEFAPPASAVASSMLTHGFKITNDAKDGPPEWQKPWNKAPGTWSEYKFLSRYFGRPRYSDDTLDSIYGLLDPERLLKMLHFSEINKMPENFPSQVLNFITEVKAWFLVDNNSPAVLGARKVLEPFGPDFFTNCMLMTPVQTQQFVCDWLRKNPSYMKVKSQISPFDAAVPQSAAESSTAETTFVHEPEVEVEQPFELAPSGVLDNMDSPQIEISRIFARPFRVASVNWLKTDANGHKLHHKNYPSTFFDLNFNAQAKMSNFAALRGTMCIKVTISSSPFSQGLALLSARPLGRVVSSEYEAMGDPSVIIDAASGQSAIIRIPTILPQGWSFVEFYGASSILFDWCNVTLTVLSALNDNGTAGAQVGIYAWLEDVELRNPTVTNFATSPQGLFEFDHPGDKVSNSRLNPSHQDGAVADDAVTKRVKTIGSYVRTYGGFLTDTVAILSVMSKFAMAAGFSVPASQAQSHFMSNASNPSSHFMIGQSSAIRLATIAAQKIALPPGIFGCKEDEMDIKHFVSRRGLMRRITWSATDAAGVVIADWYVGPGNGHCNVARTAFYHSPLSFVASMFQLYRGGIEYEFLTSKTSFHSGQLEIVWQLGTAEAPVTKDSETANCYRVIWDLQENSSLKVVLPFCSMLKWCQIFINDDSSPIVPPAYNVNHTNGALIVRVLNPLVNADATVANSVDILVLVNGSKDIEFAVPYRQPSLVYAFAGTPQPFDPKGKEPEGEREFEYGEPQTGDVFQRQASDREAAPIVLSTSSPHTPYGSVTHIGECVPNLRLFTRRMQPMLYNGVRTYSGIGATNTYQIRMYDLFLNHSDFAYLCFAFSFFSGGFRYWVRPIWSPILYGSSSSYMHRFSITPTYGALGGVAYVPVNAPVINLCATDPTAVLDVPYQSVVPFMPIHALATSAVGNGPPTEIKVVYNFTGSSSTSKGEILEEIGAADDFTFGWQTGVPTAGYTPSVGVAFNWDTYT